MLSRKPLDKFCSIEVNSVLNKKFYKNMSDDIFLQQKLIFITALVAMF